MQWLFIFITCVLNPNVNHECLFCALREIVFHVFMQCVRLKPLFSVLQRLFGLFNQHFYFWFQIFSEPKVNCQLMKFILVQAKTPVRKNKAELKSGYNVLMVVVLVKSGILTDYYFL